MLHTKIQPLPMKALGALASGVQYLFWRCSSVARQRRDLDGQFSQAHYYNLGRCCLPNFIEIGQLEENKLIRRWDTRTWHWYDMAFDRSTIALFCYPFRV